MIQKLKLTIFVIFVFSHREAPRGRIALFGGSRLTLTATNSEKTILPSEGYFSKTADRITEAASLY